jgi:hypothetical protein
MDRYKTTNYVVTLSSSILSIHSHKTYLHFAPTCVRTESLQSSDVDSNDIGRRMPGNNLKRTFKISYAWDLC